MQFKRSDIYRRGGVCVGRIGNARESSAALICCQTRVGRRCVVAGLNCRTGKQERTCLGRSAVVVERNQSWAGDSNLIAEAAVNQATAAARTDQVIQRSSR